MGNFDFVHLLDIVFLLGVFNNELQARCLIVVVLILNLLELGVLLDSSQSVGKSAHRTSFLSKTKKYSAEILDEGDF